MSSAPPLVVAHEGAQLCCQQLSGEGAVHSSEQHPCRTQGGPVSCLAITREDLKCPQDGVGLGVVRRQAGKSGYWF